jgi:argonaute-like protein implicated in RNA metabolism and viral defense
LISLYLPLSSLKGTLISFYLLATASLRISWVLQPLKGSAFKLSQHEAFLISSPPPSLQVTPWPLQIRCTSSFSIEQAIHSVLALTQLHYGSLRSPRLPISIHYSDEIAYLALKGIKPKDLEGNIPFWL